MSQCWKIALILGVFISGCAQVPRSADRWAEGEDGFAVDVKRMKGTQIIEIMSDANLDGRIDGIDLCDGLGTEGIRSLVDSDFDGKFDMQSFEINDAEHRLKSIYHDLNYDGVLDVTASKEGGSFICYGGEWLRVKIETDFDPVNARALDYHRALKKATYEIERDGKKIILHFDHDKGFIEAR